MGGTIRGELNLQLRGIDKQLRFRRSAEMLHEKSMILDVGGGKGDFFEFASCSGIVADLPPGKSLFGKTRPSSPTVYFDGLRLPFRDKSFETVVSLDTLEHTTKERRASFLFELQRVSRSKIILTFPERQFFLPVLEVIAHLHDELGISHFMRKSLDEHRKFGLPSRKDVIHNVNLNEWSVQIKTFMGPGTTGFWILQLLFPFLATPRINEAISNVLSRAPTQRGGECLIYLEHVEPGDTCKRRFVTHAESRIDRS